MAFQAPLSHEGPCNRRSNRIGLPDRRGPHRTDPFARPLSPSGAHAPTQLLSPIRVAGPSLFGVIHAQAERIPHKLAVRFLGDHDHGPACLDYAAVDGRARSLAAHLQAAGAHGERVLIVLPPSSDYVIALLACLYAGATAVPAYPPRNRGLAKLAAVALDAQARFALASPAAIEKLAAPDAASDTLSALHWLVATDIDAADADAWTPPEVDPAAPALLQYTSGSTSAPKGVRLSHANFLANIRALAERNRARPDDRVVSWLPPFHDMGLVCGILMPACTGIESTLMAPGTFLQRPLRWLAAIARHGGTISGGPNFAFELCVRRRPAPEQLAMLDLSSWRVAFCGAERVRAETMQRFADAFAPAGFRRAALTPCYGLAEATVAVTFGALGRGVQALALDERELDQGLRRPPGAGADPGRLRQASAGLRRAHRRPADPGDAAGGPGRRDLGAQPQRCRRILERAGRRDGRGRARPAQCQRVPRPGRGGCAGPAAGLPAHRRPGLPA